MSKRKRENNTDSEEEEPSNKKSKVLIGKTNPYDSKTQLKFISWNVNGLNAWIKKDGGKIYKDLVKNEQPCAFLFQETKLSTKKQETKYLNIFPGYTAHFNTSTLKGKYGTCVYTKNDGPKVVKITNGLGIDKHDKEGRTITIEYKDFFVVNNYVPNSGSGLQRLDYRTNEWDCDLQKYLLKLEKSKPVIWAGDLNCCNFDFDVHNPKVQKSAGFTPEERSSFKKFLLKNNYHDSYRMFNPENKDVFTYWGYRFNCRAKNKGWRLDYFILCNELKSKCINSYILKDIQGSDHCPIGLILSVGEK